MSNFIDDCLNGDAFLSDIDYFVDQWHQGEIKGDISLREALGMTKDEYVLWMKDPDNINFIIHARQRRIPVEAAIDEFFSLPMAARGSSKDEINSIVKWLKKEHGIS
jgi:hypothetical protein